ncbi:unnamed protein product (macronuclear) [Paramecium tetraurelia]|uniref:Transmembrane protein n=1 Tax=Paramecium tetraurelia TaxID=5888 RepID=A0BH26_PARTE|nr:uncharacterized protein GSPATT00028878001 [Paramecium tetraurelia]CAK57843.1 unnamed protein product [Paramecium tetraurelia]|eukprot:XP_001425241.1 hypothetical protein (macronuclear) [Paramecium tetraurelia strain d4-2]
MNYIINLVASLAFIWITYLVYSIKQFKHEQISDQILIFARRLLFYSSILIIFPLLIPNGLELQHNLFLDDHQYLRVVHLIDQLSTAQRETLSAYVNQEFSVKYKLMLLVPIVLLFKEIYLIAQINCKESQGKEINNNLAVSNEYPTNPIIFQAKNVSEYIPDRSEEILRIESYIRNNNIEKRKSIDEIKNSYLNNQSDLLNKLQFTIDSKKPEKILYSQYSNKQLANARHLGVIEESEQKPANLKTIHSQVLNENSFSLDNQSKPDTHIQTRIKLIIGELIVLQIILGYTAGVQEKTILSVLFIMLSQCLIIDLFDDLMQFSNYHSIFQLQKPQWEHAYLYFTQLLQLQCFWECTLISTLFRYVIVQLQHIVQSPL